jgi:hypothetical protein
MIDGSTRILVEGKGYVKVSEVDDNVHLWSGTENHRVTITPTEADRYKIKLINGIELIVDGKQYFTTYLKSPSIITSLDNDTIVYLNPDTPSFQYLEEEDCQYLNKLLPQDLGELIGLFYYISADGKVFDIPLIRRELWKNLEIKLKLLDVSYSRDEYYKRADRIKYIITDEEFIEGFKPFLMKDSFPDFFWKSKPLIQGFLKAAFTFSIVGSKMFTLRAAKDTSILKDIHQALFLFGINSSLSSGLKFGQLIVFKNNCYKLAYKIGAFNTERFFDGVDFTKFIRYSEVNTLDIKYSKVHTVDELDSGLLYKIEDGKFLANGVILENYE